MSEPEFFVLTRLLSTAEVIAMRDWAVENGVDIIYTPRSASWTMDEVVALVTAPDGLFGEPWSFIMRLTDEKAAALFKMMWG